MTTTAPSVAAALVGLVPPAPGDVLVAWSRPGSDDARTAALDAVERARLGAFARPEDADRYATGASLVRELAGWATGTPPAQVVVDRTCADCGAGHGRPRLTASPQLAVSVTHAGDRVGVALGCGADAVGPGAGVGLDVSAPGEVATVTAVAPRLRAEAEDWAVAPDDLVRLWVAKEAVLKAAGVGLLVDPRLVVVGPVPGGGLVLRRWPVPVVPSDVHLVELDAGPGYRAALAWVGAAAPRVRTVSVER